MPFERKKSEISFKSIRKKEHNDNVKSKIILRPLTINSLKIKKY